MLVLGKMLPIDLMIKKLAPVIGKEKANILLYKYNSLPNRRLQKTFEDNVRLLCYKLLGSDFDNKVLLSPPPCEFMSNENLLGDVVYNDKDLFHFGISNKELLMHTCIMGRSGSGKTNMAFKLIGELKKNKVPFLILDWKKNYRTLISKDQDVLVFTPGSKTSPFYFNPLIPPMNIEPKIWKEMLCATIGYSFFIGEGALTLMEKGIDQAYEDFGVYSGTCREYPTFKDVARIILAKGQRRGREMLWMQSCGRVLYSLTNSTLAESINVIKNPMSLEELLQRNVIIELDYLSPNNKVFLAQALLLWIYYHKLGLPKSEKLEQMIIIEEAQNLLLKGKEEMKSGNIMPKMIREFRELGVGLTFIAQEVSKMNTTALQNSYTIIALNQRYRKDIEALGSSMSLKFQEWDYLAKLPVGNAIVSMKGNYPESFMVKFPYAKIKVNITGPMLKQHMDKAYFSGFQDKFPALAEPGSFHGISKQAILTPSTLKTRNEQDLLLTEIVENPFLSVTQHYKNLGLNYREGNLIKKKLITDALVVEEQVIEGLVRKKLLSLTEKGRAYLQEKGWKGSKKIAGAEHEYWKKRIKNKLEKQGNYVKEEVPVKNEDKGKIH